MELHEKEQEVVRLHEILRATEMQMHEHRAASAAKDVELSTLRSRLDQASFVCLRCISLVLPVRRSSWLRI